MIYLIGYGILIVLIIHFGNFITKVYKERKILSELEEQKTNAETIAKGVDVKVQTTSILKNADEKLKNANK